MTDWSLSLSIETTVESIVKWLGCDSELEDENANTVIFLRVTWVIGGMSYWEFEQMLSAGSVLSGSSHKSVWLPLAEEPRAGAGKDSSTTIRHMHMSRHYLYRFIFLPRSSNYLEPAGFILQKSSEYESRSSKFPNYPALRERHSILVHHLWNKRFPKPYLYEVARSLGSILCPLSDVST